MLLRLESLLLDDLTQHKADIDQEDDARHAPGNRQTEIDAAQRLQGAEDGGDPDHTEGTRAKERNNGRGDSFAESADNTAADLHKGKQRVRQKGDLHAQHRCVVGAGFQ